MSVKMTKQRIFIIENNIQKVGQSFFHLSRRTIVIKDLLVRRQFSLVPDNRTNVNVEACIGSCKSNYHTIMTMTALTLEWMKLKNLHTKSHKQALLHKRFSIKYLQLYVK
jgi:hypothetical protein